MGAEVKQLEDELEIPRIKGNKHSKIGWKNLVKKAVKEAATNFFKENVKGKLEDGPMKHESFGQKSYLKELRSDKARTNFALRTKIIPVKFNDKNDKKNQHKLWRCDSCLVEIESQSHILHCPAYQQTNL